MKKLILLFLLCGCGLNDTAKSPVSAPKYPHYLRTADAFVGFDEKNNRDVLKELMGIDPVQYEWCAAFVNAILHVNSVPGSGAVTNNPLLARSFLHWGTKVDQPRLGDIVIFPRGKEGWQGHVGFYIRSVIIDGKQHYMILGGNQNNQVSYETYPSSNAIGIRRYE